MDDLDKPGNTFLTADGWHETSVRIPVPKEGVQYASEADAPTYEVNEVFIRKLTEVIRCAAQATDAFRNNWLSFRFYWRRSKRNIRLFSDIPNTDAMIEEDARIRALPRNPQDDPSVEYAVAPLMFWSDSTHLANFGGAHLWPIYLYFGWLSKYTRAIPSAFAAHHLAYIPSLPQAFQDWYQKEHGMSATADVLRFCGKEIMHAIWLLLLDDDFMKAYHEGMLVQCGDGILRRIFPRLFTYSADYPERVLLACLRFLGRCPCPRCYITKNDIFGMGSTADNQLRQNIRVDGQRLHSIIARIRSWVFKKGYNLASKLISRLLDPISILPRRSAFSTRFADTGFNFYSMFVPDVLHEFELGVWKAIFIHLLRILYAEGKDRIQIMNQRFRMVPTFGRNTIRRFSRNVSGLKQMAGRDFEDILQVI
ncbi:hypothetical protein DAEQUDRAFT_665724 [Daedalea quercina L-15889]|uniref:Uncharacterized protein n=1 Tax=Daedalea quercina L-15889 TaxID=1314783 RepID=A0A165S7K3_9APHY|nr:hypothetical protein DAEQUDRAFT_665724 [Daedalea quercina L-15889]